MAFKAVNLYKTISQIASSLESNLKSTAPNNTGQLQSSIDAESNDNKIEVSMLEYGIFQDKGVNGTQQSYSSPFSFTNKMPPTSAFTDTNSPFAVARSIFRSGIRPQPFIQDSIESLNLDDIAESYGKDIEDYLDKN